ncbi:TPA: hypothetical protein ACKJVB_002512 [Legionella pneumophila]
MKLLKKISFLESANFSPWPNRLIGLSPWQKSERTTKEVLDEYNNVWYKNALREWENYSNAHQSPSKARFFRVLDNIIYNQMLQNFEIYGISSDEHLISINRELYTAKWSVISALYDNFLIDILESYTNLYNIHTLVELGCGTGKNLFNAYSKLSINQIIGAEICPNAVELGNKISNQCNIDGKFKIFDYFQPNDIYEITCEISDKYMIFTSHSIEQIEFEKTNFIEQILKLKHPPEVIIHFEPIFDATDSNFFHKLHHVYTQKNLYNSDLLNVLQKYETEGYIKIIDMQKDIFGLSAFNPTSIIAWKIQN